VPGPVGSGALPADRMARRAGACSERGGPGRSLRSSADVLASWRAIGSVVPRRRAARGGRSRIRQRGARDGRPAGPRRPAASSTRVDEAADAL